jgi:hypothetical protein
MVTQLVAVLASHAHSGVVVTVRVPAPPADGAVGSELSTAT